MATKKQTPQTDHRSSNSASGSVFCVLNPSQQEGKMTDRWLSPSEAARELGLSTSMVKLLAERGQLRSERTALGRLFDPASVAELREERLRKAASVA